MRCDASTDSAGSLPWIGEPWRQRFGHISKITTIMLTLFVAPSSARPICVCSSGLFLTFVQNTLGLGKQYR
jgi:hypothetical protein